MNLMITHGDFYFLIGKIIPNISSLCGFILFGNLGDKRAEGLN
jgi:hypothetical protein